MRACSPHVKTRPLPSLRGVEYLEPGAVFTAAAECAQAKRWTFLVVGMPLRIKDATGSPLNMVAVF
jgi:hypothetical protein